MKKTGYFFFSFVPLISAVCLQFVITFPATGIACMTAFGKSIARGERMSLDVLYKTLMAACTNGTFNGLVSIGFALSCILLFGFWYKTQFQGNFKQFPKNLFKPGVCIGLLLMIPGLQMLSSIVTSVTASLFPGWMEFYEKLMKTAGLTGDITFLVAVYAVLLGPIGEELIFRGVTLSLAKRALPFWAANIFQALLFGVFHMNVIQGVYAFFIGLFLGYVCEKGGSIYISIFLHILFNAWGTLMPTDAFKHPVFAGVFLIISVIVGSIGFFLFHKNTLPREVKVLPDSSDM